MFTRASIRGRARASGICATLLLTLVVTGCQGDATSSSGDCSAGTLVASPTPLRAGQEFDLVGAGFACIDVFDDDGPAGKQPKAHLAQVTWEQEGETIRLGEVDIDAEGELTATLKAPSTATAGDATIFVETGSVVVTVE